MNYSLNEATAEKLAGDECTALDLDVLRDASQQELLAIPAEELSSHFRLARKISNTWLSERVEDNNKTDIYTFNTFRSIVPSQTDDHDCSMDSPNVVTDEERYFQIVRLRMHGTIIQSNGHEQAQMLIDWLEGIQAHVDL